MELEFKTAMSFVGNANVMLIVVTHLYRARNVMMVAVDIK